MNKFKKNKGITLVALIITIIVLLILAVVSINAVTEDGIIAKAKQARSEYQAGQNNEKEKIENYTAYITEKSENDDSSDITAEEFNKLITDEFTTNVSYFNKSELETLINTINKKYIKHQISIIENGIGVNSDCYFVLSMNYNESGYINEIYMNWYSNAPS